MRFPLLRTFAASACLHLTAASPLYSDLSIANLDKRATYNCTDLHAEPSTVCWDKLDIAGYLVGWSETKPICQATDGDEYEIDPGCCVPNEPWTTCFLRLSYGGEDSPAGPDCSILYANCFLEPLSPHLEPSIVPKVGYVVRNIVVIGNLFSSYYGILNNSQHAVTESNSAWVKLQQIVKANVTMNVGQMIDARFIGLPFWGTSTVLAGGPQQIKPNIGSAAAQAFAQSIQNTPAVGSMLFGTPVTIGADLNAESSSTYNLMDNQLDSMLRIIMSDVPTFSAWAAHGLYSGPTNSTNIVGTSGLTSALDTYITGEFLSQSRFSATPVLKFVSKDSFQYNSTCTTLGDVCRDSDNKTYYWSQAYQRAYQINEPRTWASESAIHYLDEVSAYGLLKYIETTDVYMPVLFDGAYNCTLEGKAGGPVGNLKADNSLDVACLSTLPIYLSKGFSCPTDAVQVGGKCPFGFES